MPWFSSLKLFGPETSIHVFEVSGVKYRCPHSLRRVPDNDLKRSDWYTGGPYRVSPLPEIPVPPLTPRVPRPAYLPKKKPAPWK